MLLEKETMTLEEFRALPEDNSHRYELIDGELLMQARPSSIHQEVMLNLAGEIRNHLKGKPCKVYTEIELEINKNVLIPDITVICNQKERYFQSYKEAPELVIEIISPSNSFTEIDNKIHKYRAHGIKECWIVNPQTKTTTAYNFKNNTAIFYLPQSTITSSVFPSLELHLKDIFE